VERFSGTIVRSPLGRGVGMILPVRRSYQKSSPMQRDPEALLRYFWLISARHWAGALLLGSRPDVLQKCRIPSLENPPTVPLLKA
jgi:hypothetical protein